MRDGEVGSLLLRDGHYWLDEGHRVEVLTCVLEADKEKRKCWALIVGTASAMASAVSVCDCAIQFSVFTAEKLF